MSNDVRRARELNTAIKVTFEMGALFETQRLLALASWYDVVGFQQAPVTEPPALYDDPPQNKRITFQVFSVSTNGDASPHDMGTKLLELCKHFIEHGAKHMIWRHQPTFNRDFDTETVQLVTRFGVASAEYDDKTLIPLPEGWVQDGWRFVYLMEKK